MQAQLMPTHEGTKCSILPFDFYCTTAISTFVRWPLRLSDVGSTLTHQLLMHSLSRRHHEPMVRKEGELVRPWRHDPQKTMPSTSRVH